MFFKSFLLGGLGTFLSFATANVVQSVEARAECYNSAAGKTCAAHGVLKDPQPLHRTSYSGVIDGVATSIVNCWAVARQFPERADSFSWDPKTQRCKLFTKSLASQKYVKGKSTEIYYDVGCFKCLDTCPRPLGENQFVNGGFEQFSNSILPWTTISPFRVVKPGFHSEHSFGLAKPHYQHDAHQNALVCENDYYIYTLDHKFVYTNPKYGDFTMFFGPIEYRSHLPKNNTWSTATMLATPVNGFYAKSFSFSVEAGTKPKGFYIDNVKVYRVRNPIVAPSTPNQISNGGFESGTTAHYNVSDNCSIAPKGFNSDYSLRCDVGKIGRIMPNVGHLAANAAYVFSFDYKEVRDKGAFCNLFADIGPRLGYSFSHIFPTPANATWVRREITFLVDNLEGFVHLRATAAIASKHCNYYFDNFSVKKASIS